MPSAKKKRAQSKKYYQENRLKILSACKARYKMDPDKKKAAARARHSIERDKKKKKPACKAHLSIERDKMKDASRASCCKNRRARMRYEDKLGRSCLTEVSEARRQSVKDHIHSLTKISDHNSPAKSPYPNILPPNLNIYTLYDLYCEWITDNSIDCEPVSRRYYEDVFASEFSVVFEPPKLSHQVSAFVDDEEYSGIEAADSLTEEDPLADKEHTSESVISFVEVKEEPLQNFTISGDTGNGEVFTAHGICLSSKNSSLLTSAYHQAQPYSEALQCVEQEDTIFIKEEIEDTQYSQDRIKEECELEAHICSLSQEDRT